MTLPASAPITLGQVLTELRIVNASRALPISLGDSDVRALAGVASGPISLSNLYGKSAYVPMSGSMSDVSFTAASNPASNYNENRTVALSLAGGLAPFTYAWSHVSGVGSVDAVNAASSTAHMPVARFSSPGEVSTQVVQCSVTDAMSNVFTRQCTITLTLT